MCSRKTLWLVAYFFFCYFRVIFKLIWWSQGSKSHLNGKYVISYTLGNCFPARNEFRIELMNRRINFYKVKLPNVHVNLRFPTGRRFSGGICFYSSSPAKQRARLQKQEKKYLLILRLKRMNKLFIKKWYFFH